jgi:peroxiredoxin Q/BCP
VDTFAKENAVVLGISADDVKTQKQFEEKNNLRVRLLSDTEKKVLEAYGAFGEKKKYGLTTKGILRSTFLIDPDGHVVKVWENVKVEGHATEVLQSLLEESRSVR